jgi:hypothetical protein
LLKTYSTGGETIYWYRKIDPTVVPTDVVQAAEAALQQASGELGLSGVSIQWVLPDLAPSAHSDRPDVFFRDRDFAGRISWSNEREILLNAILTPRQAARSVFHEAQHLADASVSRPPTSRDEIAIAEQRAEQFETKAASFWSRFSDAPNEWARMLRPVLLYRERDDPSYPIKTAMRQLIDEMRTW